VVSGPRRQAKPTGTQERSRPRMLLRDLLACLLLREGMMPVRIMKKAL
jgi:hypothetical protein